MASRLTIDLDLGRCRKCYAGRCSGYRRQASYSLAANCLYCGCNEMYHTQGGPCRNTNCTCPQLIPFNLKCQCDCYPSAHEPPSASQASSPTPAVERPLTGYYKEEQRRPGICGLENYSNNCYLNSVVQCLNTVEPLRQLLMKMCDETAAQRPEQDVKKSQAGPVTKSLGEIFTAMWSESAVARPDTRKLKKALAGIDKQYAGKIQQDAMETLTIILDTLNEELKIRSEQAYKEVKGKDVEELGKAQWEFHYSRNHSLVTKLFHGVTVKIAECHFCQKKSFSAEPLTSVVLPPSNSYTLSLTTQLQKYFAQQVEPGQSPCEKTGHDRTYSQKKIWLLPGYLILYVKKYTTADTRWQSSYRDTNNTWCSYDAEINLTEFVYSGGGFMEMSMAVKPKVSPKYKLASAVCHYGTADAGHYYALAYHAPSKQWYKFNDLTALPLESKRYETMDQNATLFIYKREDADSGSSTGDDDDMLVDVM